VRPPLVGTFELCTFVCRLHSVGPWCAPCVKNPPRVWNCSKKLYRFPISRWHTSIRTATVVHTHSPRASTAAPTRSLVTRSPSKLPKSGTDIYTRPATQSMDITQHWTLCNSFRVHASGHCPAGATQGWGACKCSGPLVYYVKVQLRPAPPQQLRRRRKHLPVAGPVAHGLQLRRQRRWASYGQT
jgi:hypothetical protein